MANHSGDSGTFNYTLEHGNVKTTGYVKWWKSGSSVKFYAHINRGAAWANWNNNTHRNEFAGNNKEELYLYVDGQETSKITACSATYSGAAATGSGYITTVSNKNTATLTLAAKNEPYTVRVYVTGNGNKHSSDTVTVEFTISVFVNVEDDIFACDKIYANINGTVVELEAYTNVNGTVIKI